ncbi:hypothetical protein [Altericista sp. CCNU0014]|uniref:hypothetical protein n=1 Tax=Altericista sp. CCNU0014 TaxID=3082949 RepID=UPI0038502006
MMINSTAAPSLNFQSVAFELLSYYSLEPERYPQPLTKSKVLGQWLRAYPEQWVRWALIESLYQGRYKTYSVEQILAMWHRRGQPTYHFNDEFETMICHNVPRRMEKAESEKAMVEESSAGDLESVEGEEGLALLPPAWDVAEVSSLAIASEAQPLEPKPAARESDAESYWDNFFEPPLKDTRESILTSVLKNNQLLPLTFDRSGLEPIHRFMPEAEPIEFCEKLAEIARSQR